MWTRTALLLQNQSLVCHTGNAGFHFQYCHWAGNSMRQGQVKMPLSLLTIIVAFFFGFQYLVHCCKLLTIFHSSLRVGSDSSDYCFQCFYRRMGEFRVFYSLILLTSRLYLLMQGTLCSMQDERKGDYLLQIFLRPLKNICKLPSKKFAVPQLVYEPALSSYIHQHNNFLYLLFWQGKVYHFNFNPHYKCFSEIKHFFTY